ncbi:hypothetical protein B0T20DRAFT_431332, partial [Sordaria brevicollis]
SSETGWLPTCCPVALAVQSTVACSFPSSGDPTELLDSNSNDGVLTFSFLLPLLHNSYILHNQKRASYNLVIFLSSSKSSIPP